MNTKKLPFLNLWNAKFYPNVKNLFNFNFNSAHKTPLTVAYPIFVSENERRQPIRNLNLNVAI